MANERKRDDGDHNLGPHGPPREEIIEQLEAQRNDLDDQALQQTDARDSRLGDGSETGNARRASDASGTSGGPSHLGEAEHAFERSRGEERRR